MTLRRPRHPVRWLSAAAGAAAILAAGVIFLGSLGQPPPDLDAASIVPGDALAFVSLSTDRGRPAVKSALALAEGFPGYPGARAALLRRLGSIVGGSAPAELAAGPPPWLGHEAAIAVLDTASATAGSLVAVEVSDRSSAAGFLRRAGAAAAGSYRGTALMRSRSGAALAFAGKFLLAGQDASVRAAIDTADGASPSLASASAYRSATGGSPEDAVIDAYASVAGVRRVLSAQTGALGALGRVLDQPALEGVALALSPSRSGAAVRVHSVLDPTLLRVSRSRAQPFTPTLAGVLPGGTTMLLDVGNLSAEAPRILSAGAAAGFGGGLRPLLQRLGGALGSEGVNIGSVLSSLFGVESAVAIVPGTTSPALVVISRTADEARARSQLAALELPLSQLFPAPHAGPGGAPTFNDVQVGSVTAHQLALNPGLQLDYAVFDHLIVISTSLRGIAAVAARRHTLASQPAYQAQLSSSPSSVTSLLFLDFSQLLSLAEQTGLAGRGRLRALLPDLEQIRAVGLSSTSGESDSTAELSLTIP